MIVREARAEDAADIVDLVAQLEYSVDVASVELRPQQLSGQGEPMLVAERDGKLVRLLNWHVMVAIHRLRPVGRIVAIVVDSSARGMGVGASLVAEAERRIRDAGCEKIEVTSNLVLADAHRFYERLGLERSSYRFAKDL